MNRTRTPRGGSGSQPSRSEPEKRRAILHAAVRVFAEKGYHGCRIADVARAANVAYGLVYHYFRDKEELLESVFAEQWAILINALRAIQEGPGTSSEKIAGIYAFVFDVFKTAPAAVRVLILEVTRTPHALRAGSTRETFEQAVRVVADIVRQGQERRELRPDVDPVVAATGILGALELCVSGIVIGLVPVRSEQEIERAKHEVTALVLQGLKAL